MEDRDPFHPWPTTVHDPIIVPIQGITGGMIDLGLASPTVDCVHEGGGGLEEREGEGGKGGQRTEQRDI